MIDCPLCEKGMTSLYHKELTPQQEGYHYWCKPCERGWYISDLKNIAAQNLAYTVSKGKSGKSPDEIRAILINKEEK